MPVRGHVLFCVAALFVLVSPAQAKHLRHHATYAIEDGRVVANPAGCPRIAFCGCGVSVRVFGHPVRPLFRAAAYAKFPGAAPASGNVAYRAHHVFYIESVIDAATVMAYDPNSGGHRTRIHPVSLRGYRVVNPNGGKIALAP